MKTEQQWVDVVPQIRVTRFEHRPGRDHIGPDRVHGDAMLQALPGTSLLRVVTGPLRLTYTAQGDLDKSIDDREPGRARTFTTRRGRREVMLVEVPTRVVCRGFRTGPSAGEVDSAP